MQFQAHVPANCLPGNLNQGVVTLDAVQHSIRRKIAQDVVSGQAHPGAEFECPARTNQPCQRTDETGHLDCALLGETGNGSPVSQVPFDIKHKAYS